MFSDLLPLILFFLVYQFKGIFWATSAAVIATILQILAGYVIHRRKPSTTQWITLCTVVIFGGATLWLQNELYIKWKTTMVYWLLGCVFLGSLWVGKRTLIERMLPETLHIPTTVLRKLNTYWALFCFGLGSLNLWVLYHVDTATWVKFKLFGILGLTFVFVMLQALYLARYIKEA